MIQELRKSGRWNITLMLCGMSLFCFSLSIFRWFVTGEMLYLFLNWNLFLAFIPWAAGTAWAMSKRNRYGLQALFLGITWLLFFPNAPYILTDLFHLRARANGHIWFDLVLILSFAWTGLVYGFVSLSDVESILARKMKSRTVILTSTALLFLAAFGVYLGRYMRFNSWAVWGNPDELFSEISHRFFHPAEHPRTWGMTLFMGLLLNMMYRTFRYFSPAPSAALKEKEQPLKAAPVH